MPYVNEVAEFHRKVLSRAVKELDAKMGMLYTPSSNITLGGIGIFYPHIVKSYECEYNDSWINTDALIHVFGDGDPKFGAYVFGSVPLVSAIPRDEAIPRCRKILLEVLEEENNRVAPSWCVPDDVFCDPNKELENMFGPNCFEYDLDYGYTQYPLIYT